MLKRILAVLTAVCLLFSLCGCHFGAYYIKQEGMTINYNNIQDPGSLWMTGNAVCYHIKPFLGSYSVGITSKGKQVFSSVSLGGTSQIYGNTAYIIKTWGNDEETEKIPLLCVYSLIDGSKEWIELGGITEWDDDYDIESACLLNDTLFFSLEQSFHDEETRHTPLYALPLETKKITKVCHDIAESSLGVVDGVLIYATEQDGKYQLYTYDALQNIATCVGQIVFDTYIIEGVFNYISGAAVFQFKQRELDNGSVTERVLIYDLAQREIVTEYCVDKNIDDFIVYQTYAFFVDYAFGSETGEYNTDVYRLNLSDGTYEEVITFEDQRVNLFVTSDDFVYVETDEYIYRCDMDGDKEIVCKF